MVNKIWRGDAAAVAQVVTVTPSNVEPGDLFTLTINGKVISYAAEAATVADVTAGLVEAIAASDIPEFGEITATDETTHITLTGEPPGVPFTVTGGTSDAGGFNVTVSTLQNGVADVNEKQQVRLPSATSGGTFTLAFAGQTTGAIAYNASAATVQTALEALSNVSPGDVTVTGSAKLWTVEFTGAYSGVNVPTMTGNGTNLTGAATITVATTTDGKPGQNQKYQTQWAADNSGSASPEWTVTVNGTESSHAFGEPTASSIKGAIESIIGNGNVLVTLISSTTEVVVEFIGSYGSQAVTYTLTAYQALTSTTQETQAGSETGTNEVQTVKVNDGPKAGTFTLTFEGQTTSALDYNANAATVQAALEALSNVGAGNVAVTLSGATYTVTFQGDLHSTDLQQMTADASSLTGGNVYCDTTQTAVAGRNEAQRVSFSQTPSGGTFTLTYDGQTTAGIAYNATAATVEAALEALSNIDAVAVTGDGPWTVEFKGTLALTDVVAMTGDGSGLTGSGGQAITVTTTTDATGPNHWDNAGNWTPSGVPATGDVVFIEDGRSSILYGLDQSAVTLASMIIDSRYSGTIGLPKRNALDYWEYRETDLAIGITSLVIGLHQGPGSSRVQIDLGSVASTIEVLQTGGTVEAGVPALLLKGSAVTNTLLVIDGDVGFAFRAAETGYLQKLTQRGGNVQLGKITLETLDKTGGSLFMDETTRSGVDDIRG